MIPRTHLTLEERYRRAYAMGAVKMCDLIEQAEEEQGDAFNEEREAFDEERAQLEARIDDLEKRAEDLRDTLAACLDSLNGFDSLFTDGDRAAVSLALAALEAKP